MADNSNTTVAVLGTGLIGAPVARNLRKHGFSVRVWNRTPDKADALSTEGIAAFGNPAQAVDGADIVVTVLKDADSVRDVIHAASSKLKPDAVWLQLSTVGVEGINALSALGKELGITFYDAPVQGSRQPAEAGQLVILASGPASKQVVAQQVFDAIGKRTLWLSDSPGVSSRLKLALNSWVLALTHGLAESLLLADRLGVQRELLVEVVTGGPMDSPFFQAKAAAILSDNYAPSFTVDNAIKDALLVVEAAAAAGVRLDGASAGLERYKRAVELGHGDKDMAASYLA